MSIKKQTIHANPWFSLEKHDFEGGGVYYFVHKKPSVFIIAENDEGKIVFIEESRYPTGTNILQLPAGMVDEGTELFAAKRELLEETGVKAKIWKRIGEFYVAPGHEDTKIVVFHAKELDITPIAKPEKDIKYMHWYSNNEVEKLIKDKKIKCGITLASLQLFSIESDQLIK